MRNPWILLVVTLAMLVEGGMAVAASTDRDQLLPKEDAQTKALENCFTAYGIIASGEMFQCEVRPLCPRPDNVTFTWKPAFKGGLPQDASIALEPNPVPTGTAAILTIATAPNTLPKAYGIRLEGQGTLPDCANHTYNVNLTVVPKVVPSSQVIWSFNGERPGAKFPVVSKLTVTPAGYRTTWVLSLDNLYVRFQEAPDAGKIVTNRRSQMTVEADPKFPVARNRGLVNVRVEVNGIKSEEVQIRLRKPHFVEAQGIEDRKAKSPISWCPADLCAGYESFIYYSIKDQFGDAVPEGMPVNEGWNENTPPSPDQFNNYLRGAQVDGKTGSGGGFQDVIRTYNRVTCNNGEECNPPVGWPRRGVVRYNKVHHWCGGIYVGSRTPQKGVKVARVTWQRYTDHGRHCDVESPPASGLLCPPSTIDCPN